MNSLAPAVPNGVRVCRAASRLAFGLVLLVFAVATRLAAQPAADGAIAGRVFNSATGEYVRNAEVRVPGTSLVTYSRDGGEYRLEHVPAGAQKLVVSFSGHTDQTVSVTVNAGETTTREVELGGQAEGAAMRLDAFTVQAEREGNAKAIMEQKRNMNISTAVASDVFGDVAEGNVGEFLKYLPGVDLEYVDAETRGPRLGGLDPQYVGVTMDGQKIASADAFASYGSMINGSAGAAVRSTGFEQMSITSLESIEVNRTASADMDADAPAGTINLKSKRAFDRKGRRIDWQVSLSGNSDEFTFGKTYGPGDKKNYLVRPNYILDYSDVFLEQRLGVHLGISQSKVLFEQQYVTDTYNRTPTAADPRPAVLTAIAYTDGPKFVDRFTTTLTSDFKASDRLVLSLTAMFNAYDGYTFTRALTFTAAANNTNANTGRAAVLGDGLTDIRTNGVATNTAHAVSYGGQNFDKLTNTVTVSPKFEYKLGRSVVADGALTYSYSKNDYEGLVRGTSRLESIGPLVADFRATRPDTSSAEWTITQTGGPDWSNLANFTNPRLSTEDGRFALVKIYSGEVNARYTAPWSLPTFFKAGFKDNEEYRKSDNTTVYNSYQYIGPGGGPTGSFAAFPSPRPFSTTFGHIDALNTPNVPTMVNRMALGDLFRAHPEYFVNNATVDNYYNAFYANHRDFKQTVTAGYGMANTRLGALQIQGGLRWEKTQTDSKEFNPRTAAQVAAAGFPINASTRRATTTAGIDYQYGSQPRVTRHGEYENLFPSISAKYAIRPNLFAQFGYSYAISRPPIDSLSGVWSVNDTTMQVFAPNPNLKPELSDNYVGRIAYYFEPAGSFTFLVQQNEIKHLRVSREFTAEQFGYGDDPSFAGYTFESTDNGTQLYRYRNFELGYNQQLTFLPGPFRGTSVNLSYSRSYANQWRPGVVPNKVTGGVGWSYKRVNFRAGVVWQDDTPYTTLFGRTLRHNFKIDLSGGFRITNRISLFFQGRNILNDPQLIYEGDPVNHVPSVLYRYGNYGTSWVFGVKGNL